MFIQSAGPRRTAAEDGVVAGEDVHLHLRHRHAEGEVVERLALLHGLYYYYYIYAFIFYFYRLPEAK